MDPDDIKVQGSRFDRPMLVSPTIPDPAPPAAPPPVDDVRQVYGETLTAEQEAALEARMRARAMARRAPPEPAAPTPKPTDGAKPKPAKTTPASGANAGELPIWEQAGLWLTSKIWGGMAGDPGIDSEIASGARDELPWIKNADRMGTVNAIADDIGKSDFLAAGVRGARGAIVNAPGSTATLLTGAGNKGVELYNDYLAAPFMDMLGLKDGSAMARQWSGEARARQADAERQAQNLTQTINGFVPSAGTANTNTEAFVEGVSQFVTGFALTKKVAPGRIGGNMVTDVVARGAAVNTVAFDPKAPTAANLVEEFFPDLKDSFITATSIDETDTGFEAQFKRAIEGVGLDAAVEGVLMGFARFMRSAKKADAAQLDGQSGAAEEVRKVTDTAAEAERAVATLGDSAGPDIGDAPPTRARMFEGITEPAEKAAMAESALRRAGAFDVRTGTLSLDELDKVYGGGKNYTPEAVLDMMDTVKAGQRPKPILTFVRSQGGIRETDTFAGEVGSIEAPKLLNRNSRFDLDAMAEKAAEAGYIPYDDFGRHDVNDLIDALKRDYAAEDAGDVLARVYSGNDAEAVGNLPGLLRMEQELAELGVDAKMRGPRKRQLAAQETVRRAAAANFGGEARTLDDLESLQADMDAAGVAGFQTFDDVMEGAGDGARDADGLFDPEALAQGMPQDELAARISAMSDSDAFGSALTYLDLEAKTGDEARKALLGNALEHQRRAAGTSPIEKDEAAFLRNEARALADDAPEAAPESAQPPPPPVEQPWQSFAGQKAMAERLLKNMKPESAVSFIDTAISMATDAEHKVGLQRVRRMIEDAQDAKYSDSAGDAVGRAESRLRPRRTLTVRETAILDDITKSAEAGVDPLAHLNALGVQGEAAREIISHALQQGRLGPRAAARASLGAKPGGMLSDVRGRVPDEVTDAQIAEASGLLSPQEFEVWKLAKIEGQSNAAIADALARDDGVISAESIKVVLSKVRRKAKALGKPFLDVSTAPSGMPMGDVTKRIIDLKAQGVRNVDVAARVYPDVPTEVGARRVAVLMVKWRDAIKERRAALSTDKDAKFAEWSQMTGERLPSRIPPEQPSPEIAQMLDARLPKNATDETRKIVAWSGYEAPPAWIARWLRPEATAGERDVLVKKIWGVRNRNQALIWDIFEKVTPNGKASDGPGGSAAPASREDVGAIASEIVRQFGKEGESLLRSGGVVLHSSAATVPFPVVRDTIRAAYKDGVVHVIANRITPQQIYGLMLHEVGVHAGMREMLGGDGFEKIMTSLRDMVSGGDEAAYRAYSEIPAVTRNARGAGALERTNEELLAYYVQNAPQDAPLFRRITAGMAAWLYRNFPQVTNFLKPSQEALRQMAVRSLRRYAQQTMDRPFTLGADSDHIGFYSGVERAVSRMEAQTFTPADLVEHIREQPGVREEELRNLNLETAFGRKKLVTIDDARRVIAERRLFLDRQVSTVRGKRDSIAPGSAKDVRDVVFRLPADATGGNYSRTGGRDGGKLSVARVSTRKTTDGRELMQIESLDSDVHPQNGYEYLRPEIIDPDTMLRQEQLRAGVQGAEAPLKMLEAEGREIAGSLPEYQAWQDKRQLLLNDIATNGDHIGFMAGQMGVNLPPQGTPLRGWATTTLRNLLAAASVTEADGLALPVAKMLKDATPGQQHFLEVEVKQALERAAKDLELEIGTATVNMGKLGEVEVPAVFLSPVDRARIVQSGVPMYAEGSGPRGGSGEPANNLRVQGPGGQTIYVNLARIAADGDIKATIQKLADRYADNINAARGGERQADDQLLKSVAAVDAWEVLRNRRAGEPLGAKESLAARQLWAASAEWITQIADRYRNTKSPTDKFAFNQALAVHRAIQAEVIGARTETARALRSWAIPMGSTAEKLEQISGILTMNGVANVDELAGRLARLGQDQVGILDEVVEKSFRAKTSDVLGEIWRGSLLSNPKTHIVNLLGNTSIIAYDLAETGMSGAVARLLRMPEAGEMVGEAAAKYHGVMAALRAQMKFMHENGRFNPTGEASAVPGAGVSGRQTDAPRPNAVSAESFGLNGETLAGATADAVGAVINTPQALLGGSDDFFKGINYQGELYGQAHRIASAEVRLGTLEKADIASRIASLVDEPTEPMQVAARRAAQERTFTTPPKAGGVVSAMFRVRDWMNAAGLPLGHFILPFINTPANIMKWTFSRTPAGLLMSDMQRKLRAGGKDAMLAKVQIAMGTSGLMLGYQLAASGQITGGGPIDQGERQALVRTGWQPYSLKIGDTWVAYQRFDPLATYLSLSADFQEISANLAEGDASVEQAGEVAALAIGAVGNAFLSKTYLQGVSDFNAFLADPGRYGERYLSNIAGSMLGPAGAAEIRRQVDPAMRDVTDIMDSIKNRWPGASNDLPVARDLWGRPRTYQSHLGMAYDALSPFSARKVDPEAIDSEMLRLGYFPQLPNRSITVPVGGRSVSVPLRNKPEIYNRMLELSGERALKMANALVKSPSYQNLMDGKEPLPGTKAFAIETVILRNRDIGRMLAMKEFWGPLQDLGRKELARELEGALAQ